MERGGERGGGGGGGIKKGEGVEAGDIEMGRITFGFHSGNIHVLHNHYRQ